MFDNFSFTNTENEEDIFGMIAQITRDSYNAFLSKGFSESEAMMLTQSTHQAIMLTIIQGSR